MNNAPFPFVTVEAEVRDCIIAQASCLEALGPDENNVEVFLGITTDEYSQLPSLEVGRGADPEFHFIDFKRHQLWHLARLAYGYAYQIPGYPEVEHEHYYDIDCCLPHGYAQTDRNGFATALNEHEDSSLKQMFETFKARWALDNPDYSAGFTVRDLSLLSNMTVPAVRNSLSKEGFKLSAQGNPRHKGDEDRNAVLGIEDAKQWLSRRRGFVPTRKVEPLDKKQMISNIFLDTSLSLPQAMQKSINLMGKEAVDNAVSPYAEPVWLASLLIGAVVEINIPAIRALAKALDRPEASFTAAIVRHLISLEQNMGLVS